MSHPSAYPFWFGESLQLYDVTDGAGASLPAVAAALIYRAGSTTLASGDEVVVYVDPSFRYAEADDDVVVSWVLVVDSGSATVELAEALDPSWDGSAPFVPLATLTLSPGDNVVGSDIPFADLFPDMDAALLRVRVTSGSVALAQVKMRAWPPGGIAGAWGPQPAFVAGPNVATVGWDLTPLIGGHYGGPSAPGTRFDTTTHLGAVDDFSTVWVAAATEAASTSDGMTQPNPPEFIRLGGSASWVGETGNSGGVTPTNSYGQHRAEPRGATLGYVNADPAPITLQSASPGVADVVAHPDYVRGDPDAYKQNLGVPVAQWEPVVLTVDVGSSVTPAGWSMRIQVDDRDDVIRASGGVWTGVPVLDWPISGDSYTDSSPAHVVSTFTPAGPSWTVQAEHEGAGGPLPYPGSQGTYGGGLTYALAPVEGATDFVARYLYPAHNVWVPSPTDSVVAYLRNHQRDDGLGGSAPRNHQISSQQRSARGHGYR